LREKQCNKYLHKLIINSILVAIDRLQDSLQVIPVGEKKIKINIVKVLIEHEENTFLEQQN
jgi:hypothetical protein